MKYVLKIQSLLRHQFASLAALLIIDFVFFTSTNETKVAVYFIIIGFGLLVSTIYFISRAILEGLRLYGFDIKYSKKISTYITVVLSAIAALQSTGQLSARDVAVMLPLALIGFVYTSYPKSDKGQIS
jgi:hypothetical protein